MSKQGYWVYDIIDTSEKYPIEIEEGIESSELPDDNIVTVYRPVIIEENDDGEIFAYYYDSDAEPMEILETGGKKYVLTQQVHRTPPTNGEPAYKYE